MRSHLPILKYSAVSLVKSAIAQTSWLIFTSLGKGTSAIGICPMRGIYLCSTVNIWLIFAAAFPPSYVEASLWRPADKDMSEEEVLLAATSPTEVSATGPINIVLVLSIKAGMNSLGRIIKTIEAS